MPIVCHCYSKDDGCAHKEVLLFAFCLLNQYRTIFLLDSHNSRVARIIGRRYLFATATTCHNQPDKMATTPHGTSNGGGGGGHASSPPAANSPPMTMAEIRMHQETQKRMGQLFDENDHRRCSEGNRKALLAEKMEQLRGLAKEFEGDDWKYAAPVSAVAASATSSILMDAQLELGGRGTSYGSSPKFDDAANDDPFLQYGNGSIVSGTAAGL
jgi:hypothetical protein